MTGFGRDQASNLRELVRRGRRRAHTVAVCSGKGGVGKTNLAVNLSICLAEQRHRVLLADLDLGLANADLLLNAQPRYNLSHVMAGLRGIEEILLRYSENLLFAPGASGTESLANVSEFERRHLLLQLQQASRNTDIAVLDCGAGLASNVITFAAAADRVVIVTTPQPTAMADAYATIKALLRAEPSVPIELFVNMVTNRAEAEQTFDRIDRVANRFLNYSVANGGFMLHDTRVQHAVRLRKPFVLSHPDANASACIAALAGRLARNITSNCDVTLARQGNGLLRKVANLFL